MALSREQENPSQENRGRTQAEVSWIPPSSLRWACPVQLKSHLFEELPILVSAVKGYPEDAWNRVPNVGLRPRPIQLWRNPLNFIIYVHGKCQQCSYLCLRGGKGLGGEGEEPFLTLLSECNYILLILNAILASCEKFKDHRMMRYKVKVYSIFLAPSRNSCC